MLSKTMLLGLAALMAIFLKDEPACRLPQPNFEKKESDPAWLAAVVQFHGHLGPSIVAGARLGMAGLRATEAKGYFDVEIACEGPFVKPPQSCFLDGLQVSTGATMGKRNLQFKEAEQVVVRVKNTKTGKTVEVRPTPELLEILGFLKTKDKIQTSEQTESTNHKHDEMTHLEAIARQIAELPDGKILSIK